MPWSIRETALSIFGLLVASALVPLRAQETYFDQRVAPILIERCIDCHSGQKPKGGLDLSSKSSVFTGGKSGPALVPRNSERSVLWQRVEADEMPPKKPLPPKEKALLKAWIADGASWGTDPIDPFRVTTQQRAGYDWWSLQPVKRPALPRLKRQDWPSNPIDHFILAKLEAEGLAPAPAADPRTLIRRLYFDLIGLPPTPEETVPFVKEWDAANSAEKQYSVLSAVVNRLLESPHYGERWARHWLDVVRFGESNGFEYDELRKNAWPYRDWVIEAFNRDMPYDEFVRCQIAGDVLGPNDPSAIVATGFLVAGGYDTVGQKQQSAVMKAVVRQDELEDYVGTIGQTFLGLTVQCARCHDHKFDPVRQTEYYRLSAAVAGVNPGERDVSSLQEANAPKVKSVAYAVAPKAQEKTHVLLRGTPSQPGALVTPGGVAALGGKPDFGLSADAPDAERRRKLAEWITDAKNPLTPRVLANRLWHYHFGAGIVETPSDLGFNGARPSHPELLDWLASELMQPSPMREEGKTTGWSMKHLHRLIVTSAAYRQASSFRPEAARRDTHNRWLWRKSPLRLEAETVRDTILTVAGQLNPARGGPGYQDFKLMIRGSTYYYLPNDADDPALYRRSIYRTWARSGRNPLLDALDCPDPSTVTPRRALTTTPLQALALMNNAFVLRMADRLSERLKREAGEDRTKQIARGYELAYGRRPTQEELQQAQPVIERHGLSSFCRALFNSNEFVFVD